MAISNPLNIAGCVLWCDASQITGKNDGDTVAQFDDLSGLGHHLIQNAGGATIPQFKVNILNGMPALRFDGSNDAYRADFTGSTTTTVFMVCKKRSAAAGSNQWALAMTSVAAGVAGLLTNTGTGAGWNYYPDAGFAAIAIGGDPTAAQIMGLRSITTASMDVIVEGALAKNINPEDNFGSFTNIAIAGDNAGANNSDIDVFEIIEYNVALTNAQVGDVLDYLGQKWGVVGLHPHYIADRGSQADTTGAGTTVVDLPAAASIPVGVGQRLILRVAVDNSGSSGAAPGLTVADAWNGSWTVYTVGLADPGAANAGIAGYIAISPPITIPYVNGDDVTLTWGAGNPAAKAAVIEEWANIHQTTPRAVTEATASGTASPTSASITPTAAGQLVYVLDAIESGTADTYTQDTDTTAGFWKTGTRLGAGLTTAGSTNNGSWKIVQSNAAQAHGATITSRDWASIAIVFAAVDLSQRPAVRPRVAGRVSIRVGPQRSLGV